MTLVFSKSESYAASSSEGLSVDPVFQDLTLENGKEIETAIYISNDTIEPQEVEISAIDITQESLTGKLIFLAEDLIEYPHSLAPYIKFDKDRFVILPGTKEQLTAFIEDRENIKPGGHYAAILVKAQSKGNDNKTTVLPALASILFIKKTGNILIKYELQNLSGLNKIQTTVPEVIATHFFNDGNVHFTPRGIIEISGWSGRILGQKIFNPDSSVLFPDTQRVLNTQIDMQVKPWLIEPLKLKFSYRDASESELRVRTVQGIYIHSMLLKIILVLILIIVVWRFWIYKSNKSKQKHDRD